MFKRKPKTPDETNPPSLPARKRTNWLRISIFANIAILIVVAGVSGAAVILHQSDTDPNFCATCHIMQPNVTSYLTGDNLDHVHYEAGVQCKECHSDYGIPEEVASGIRFVTNDYELDENGVLAKRDFGDEICTQCHVSLAHVAVQTDFLYYNPHGTRMGTFPCNTCHLSHGEQIDYCSECHTNGGQRMIGDTTPREEVLGEPVNPYGSMFGG
jgi:hypothetical protein